MALKRVICGAFLLCFGILQTSGQRIIPSPVINGQAGQSVSIICEPSIPGRSGSNVLQIFSPQQMYINFETTADADARLTRNETEGSQLTNYTFGPLTAQDDGTVFRCLSAGTVSGNSTINVQFAPIITPVTQVFEATESMPFMATFNVSANPPQSGFSWEKDGQPLTANARISLSLTSIQFTSVLREDAGMYSLSVTNSLGTTTFRFNLTVRFGPEFDPVRTDVFNCSEPSADGSLRCASYDGVTGRLLCTPVGYPLPTVNVVSAGVSELSNVVISGGEIAITSVQSGNAGNYTCTVTSSLGTIVGLIQFFVGGAAVPVNIAIVNRTDDYIIIRLTYDNSQNDVPATTFYVDIVRMDTNEVVASFRYPVTASELRNISISKFRALEDRMFNVFVRAENLHGNSTALSDNFTIRGGATVLYASSLLCVLLSLVVILFY